MGAGELWRNRAAPFSTLVCMRRLRGIVGVGGAEEPCLEDECGGDEHTARRGAPLPRGERRGGEGHRSEERLLPEAGEQGLR